MLKVGISFTKRGKSLLRLNTDLKVGLEESVNENLNLIRKSLINEAPSTSKGNKYSQNRIINFLSNPSNCVRKTSKHVGYVFLSIRKLPHLKYVLHGHRSKIYPKNSRLLVFWKPFEGRYIFARFVKGRKANNFIQRAYINVRGSIYNTTGKHIHKAIRKK